MVRLEVHKGPRHYEREQRVQHKGIDRVHLGRSALTLSGIRGENPRFHGTKQLMLAVLVDALQCLRTGAQGSTAIQLRALAEAEAWIADRKGQGPFAFETICETLEINPDWLRESLRGWRNLPRGHQRSVCRVGRDAGRGSSYRADGHLDHIHRPQDRER